MTYTRVKSLVDVSIYHRSEGVTALTERELAIGEQRRTFYASVLCEIPDRVRIGVSRNRQVACKGWAHRSDLSSTQRCRD